jgi:hypothetical protein
MFILESKTAKAAKKMSILMGTAFVLTASFGAILTMHIYVKPSPPSSAWFSNFGFSSTIIILVRRALMARAKPCLSFQKLPRVG